MELHSPSLPTFLLPEPFGAHFFSGLVQPFGFIEGIGESVKRDQKSGPRKECDQDEAHISPSGGWSRLIFNRSKEGVTSNNPTKTHTNGCFQK